MAEVTGESDIAMPGCGHPLGALPADARIPVTADFPPRIARAADGFFEGTVSVTNLGRAMSGVTSPGAGVYVLRDGYVVSTPLPQDLVAHSMALEAGASATLPARGSIRSCIDDELLPVGQYGLVAVVVVYLDDGPAVVGASEPWTVHVT